MSARMKSFESYAAHAWLNKSFRKLSAQEKEIARDFIRRHDALSKGDFEHAVNRMFLDRERPKNWTIILELLANANSNGGAP